MKRNIFYPMAVSLAAMLPLGGCMAWTDGVDSAGGAIYTDYNPFGSLYFGPDAYYDSPYAGPVYPLPAYRPVFGYPSWGGSLNRPNTGPVFRPGTGTVPDRPGNTPSRPNGNGQRPGANITTLPGAKPVPTSNTSGNGATGTRR